MQARNGDERPLCALVGERGVKDTSDFAEFFTALMIDVVDGNVDAEDATAVCRAGGKALESIEMEHRLGNGQPVKLGRRALRPQVQAIAGEKVVAQAPATPDIDKRPLQ